jgi:hypothetical protein
MELFDDPVVLGIILGSAAGVDHARDSEPVHLAHEVARGALLILRRQLRPFRQRGIEDGGVGICDQQAGRLAVTVADDLAAGKVGRVPGVTDGAHGGAIEQGPVVEMQQEDRRVRGDRVDLVERGQALLGKLVRRETADHADPLRRRRAVQLLLEHTHRVGQRPDSVPAQLHIVVEAAADDVHVAVDQPGNCAAAVEVDDLRARARQRAYLAFRPDPEELAVRDRHRLRRGVSAVEGGKAPVQQDQVGSHFGGHDVEAIRTMTGGAGDRRAGSPWTIPAMVPSARESDTSARLSIDRENSYSAASARAGTAYSGNWVGGALCTIV